MKFAETGIAGLSLVALNEIGDQRGRFARLYCAREMQAAGIGKPIVQINHSITAQKGSMRGLHFQYPPVSETKIIRCMNGAVWDVAVDLRKGSPTFLQWRAFELRADKAAMLVIPEGCAHGFQTLSDDAALLYFHTAYYDPAQEGGFNSFDPRLAIDWPLPVQERSERDKQLPEIPADFEGLVCD